MMKSVFSSLLLASLPALAQTTPTAKAPVKPVVHKAATASGCATLPTISPKVPALPAGLPCAKHLYTITLNPPALITNVASFESSESLHEILRIQEPATFSLDYIDVAPGTGAAAAPKKWLTVEYTGYLTDGTKFDSSADHPGTPFSFAYGQIGGPGSAVVGWETGFGGMKVGAQRRLFVPQQLGYGVQTKGSIPPKSMLIFDVKLVAVSDTNPNPPPAPKTPPTPPAGLPKLAPPAAPAATPAPAPAPATAPAAASPKPPSMS